MKKYHVYFILFFTAAITSCTHAAQPPFSYSIVTTICPHNTNTLTANTTCSTNRVSADQQIIPITVPTCACPPCALTTTDPKTIFTATIETVGNRSGNNHRSIIPALAAWSIGLLASTYGVIHGRIYYLKKRLANPSLWSTWQTDLPIAALHELPEEDVASTLRADIETVYQSQTKSFSLLHIVTLCMQDIDQELKEINELALVYNYIKKLRLTYFFPQNDTLLEQCTNQQKRLEFLKKIINTVIIQ